MNLKSIHLLMLFCILGAALAESAHAASSTVSDEIVDANVLPSPTFVLEAEEDDQLNGRVEKEEAAHPVPTVQVTDPEFLESMDHVFSVTDSSSSSGSISDSEVEEKEEAYGHEDHQSSSNLEGDEVKEFKMSLKNLREQVNTLFKLQLIGFTRKVRTFSSVNKTIRTFLKAHSGYYYALLDESPYAKAYKKNDFMALDLQTGAIVSMRETDLVGVHENRCNQLMGQLEHSSFKSHKYWGKRWLATKIYLDGRPLSKVLQDSETTMFDAEVLMSKATKELERLHDFGYRYGLGQSVSKDNFIVDGSGGVHLINYRSCYKLRI